MECKKEKDNESVMDLVPHLGLNNPAVSLANGDYCDYRDNPCRVERRAGQAEPSYFRVRGPGRERRAEGDKRGWSAAQAPDVSGRAASHIRNDEEAVGRAEAENEGCLSLVLISEQNPSRHHSTNLDGDNCRRGFP
jgi:hypothetical protein